MKSLPRIFWAKITFPTCNYCPYNPIVWQRYQIFKDRCQNSNKYVWMEIQYCMDLIKNMLSKILKHLIDLNLNRILIPKTAKFKKQSHRMFKLKEKILEWANHRNNLNIIKKMKKKILEKMNHKKKSRKSQRTWKKILIILNKVSEKI